MKRIATYLTVQQITALKRISAKTGIKPAELIRRALDKFIKANN